MSRLVSALTLLLLACSLSFGQSTPASGDTEWRNYGRDPVECASLPLKQIDSSNVQLLQRAWTYHSRPRRIAESALLRARP